MMSSISIFPSSQYDLNTDERDVKSQMMSIINDSVNSEQRRPRSDCANAQSDLGLRCSHLYEGVIRMFFKIFFVFRPE